MAKDGMPKTKKGRQSLRRAAKKGGRNLKGLRVRSGHMTDEQRLSKSLNEGIITMPEVVALGTAVALPENARKL